MNKKINSSDLAEMLVENYGFDKKLANNFVKEFQKTIVDGLEKDKIVKINGLGTFKLTLIAERKSVNVQTGEAIIIPQHYKVTFVADNSVKTLLNTPVTPDAIDPLKKMAEQANEINDILKDFNNNNSSDSTNKDNTTDSNSPKDTEKPEDNTQTTEQEKEKTEEPNKEIKNIPTTKSYKWLIWTSLICLLLMIGGGVYYLYSDEINRFFQKEQITEQVVIEEPEPTKPTEEPEPSETSVFQQEIDYSETLTTETIRKGTRLAYFATQYYGHPDFWIYIYEANKDIIKDPSNVLIGTQIKIPKLPAELIDATNENAINFAISLAEKRN